MANRTVKDAKSIRGTNPQYLVEKIIRSRVYDSKYWKEECFALTAELLVDKAMELRLVNIYKKLGLLFAFQFLFISRIHVLEFYKIIRKLKERTYSTIIHSNVHKPISGS